MHAREPTAPESEPGALLAELETLRARQVVLLETIRANSVVDEELLAKSAATFSRVPKYADKLRHAKVAMNELAARTTSIRQRVEGIVPK
jgi:hypothetical protein